MFALLVVPLKKTFPVDMTNPLTNLINRSYNGNNANVIDHSGAINELNKLRNTALGRTCIKYESLEIIYNYYDQLIALESKIPLHKLQDVSFKWKNAFEKKMFKGPISLTLPSLAHEKQCVLFNIAALQNAVAATQGTYRDNGFKLAIKLLQKSAGIFAHLKSVVIQESTSDLDSDTLLVLSDLMLAQAQEIYVLKAMKHHMKDSTVAKLATSCQYLYQRVLRDLQKHSHRSIWEKNWITTVNGKQAGFHAIAQFYQSLVCRSNEAIGEEIARLQYSIELFKEAKLLHSGELNFYEEFEIQAQQNLTDSKRDNDLIYNATIPNVKTLVDLEQTQMVNVLPFTTPLSLNSKDLFVYLVPVVLQKEIDTSDIRKSEIVGVEMMKLRESSQNLNETLVRLNLPAAIEVTIGSTLPRSILNKAKDIQERGGIDGLRTLIAELPKSLKRNQDILDECNRMLKDEAEADTHLRTQFKDTCKQKPSEKLTKTIRSNISKYREIIDNAVLADKEIQETFEKHVCVMELLLMPPSELENECPAGDDGNILNCHSARKLRKLMENVDTIKAEREVIESELKSATIDLKGQFLNALAKDGAINGSNISDDSIRKIFEPLCKRVHENILQKKILIEQIQSVHHTFERESSGRFESRDAFLSELAGAYDAFTTLQKHLKEGIKFYNDLTYLLITFQNKVSDFCAARKKEEFDLIKSYNEESNSTISHQRDLIMNLSQEQKSQMDETTTNAQPSLHITPIPRSFNPYATYTIKKHFD